MYKQAYLLTLKEVFNDTEKYIFLDQKKANSYFRKAIKQAFTENEVKKDENENNIKQCIDVGIMESDPYTATLEEITLIN